MSLSEIQLQRFETLKAVLHYFYRDNTRSGSHCRHTIKYHFVWIPKYRKLSREGAFLKKFLKGFTGVLISDFYAAYDSLNCPQQKCLVHLIRDFNDDIHANPWDEELKSLAGDFGNLL